MLITFCFGVSSNLWQQKSPIAEVLRIYFLRTIFWRKFMCKISTVGLFCCNKFEETPKQKVINMSKLNKLHFKRQTLKRQSSFKNYDIEKLVVKLIFVYTKDFFWKVNATVPRTIIIYFTFSYNMTIKIDVIVNASMKLM